MTGASLSQPAGIEIYKYNDGHIYALDLTSPGAPAAQQLSSESAATIDDTCTLSGTAVAGANYDYVGVYFTADLQTTTNSSYFYRLPGPDGVCNTADDIIHMVKSGMTAATAPIVASGMPVATVRTAMGGISGFVVKSGADLMLVDSNFANPIILGTFAAPIGVAVALPTGTTQGYPTGQLYVVDGNIVHVDYVAHAVSAPLYTIPNWSATSAGSLFAASPTTLYFSINTPAAGSTPASAHSRLQSDLGCRESDLYDPHSCGRGRSTHDARHEHRECGYVHRHGEHGLLRDLDGIYQLDDPDGNPQWDSIRHRWARWHRHSGAAGELNVREWRRAGSLA
jgi:hypothetical protein